MLSDGPTAAATAVSVLAVIPVSLLACVLWRLTIIVRALEKLQEAELSRIVATSPSPSGLRRCRDVLFTRDHDVASSPWHLAGPPRLGRCHYPMNSW